LLSFLLLTDFHCLTCSFMDSTFNLYLKASTCFLIISTFSFSSVTYSFLESITTLVTTSCSSTCSL
jgi:hypothetical protein